jgi:hypothetical protein
LVGVLQYNSHEFPITTEKDRQIAELSRRIVELENKITESHPQTVDPIPCEKDTKIENLKKVGEET